ncbi:hypothetical protein C8R44DRAFT_171786 [Mycena epipterygia]|nr:hypothetical protein C8R44DRAFT_171786 [Mycena epipterygia]
MQRDGALYFVAMALANLCNIISFYQTVDCIRRRLCRPNPIPRAKRWIRFSFSGILSRGLISSMVLHRVNTRRRPSARQRVASASCRSTPCCHAALPFPANCLFPLLQGSK